MKTIKNKLKILYNRPDILDAIDCIAARINQNYAGQEVHLVIAVTGGIVFATDLMMKLTDVRPKLHLVDVTSYHGMLRTEPRVTAAQADRLHEITDNPVIIIDDICDTGHTIKALARYLAVYEPSSIEAAVMLDKPSCRKVKVEPEYIGKTIEDVFVVGYGLDYNEHYRNLPYIAILDNT